MAQKDKKDDSEESENYSRGKNKKSASAKASARQRKMNLKEETRYSVWGIIFFVVGFLILLSIFKAAGMVGEGIYWTLNSIFGLGYYLLPILFIAVGFSFMKKERPYVAKAQAIFSFICLLSALAIIDLAVNGNIPKVVKLQFSVK